MGARKKSNKERNAARNARKKLQKTKNEDDAPTEATPPDAPEVDIVYEVEDVKAEGEFLEVLAGFAIISTSFTDLCSCLLVGSSPPPRNWSTCPNSQAEFLWSVGGRPWFCRCQGPLFDGISTQVPRPTYLTRSPPTISFRV